MNMNLLNEKIEASGYKREYIAQQLNITRFGLRDKMLNPNRWKASEAATIIKLLNLTEEESQAIFGL